MQLAAKRTPSLSPSPSNASTNQAPPSQANRVLGMINRILGPKNQEHPTTTNALPESVTILTQHKNNSIPEDKDDNFENEKSNEVETTIVTKPRRKNPFLAKIKYPTIDSILCETDDSETELEPSQDDETQIRTQIEQDDPSSEENLEIKQKFPQLTQMEQQFDQNLDQWDSENATEVVTRFQEMFNQLTTFSDQLRLEQEAHVNQLDQREIQITDCLLEIKTHRSELNDRENKLTQRENNLEEKWKEMTAAIEENKDSIENHPPGAAQIQQIDDQVQQGLTHLQQQVDDVTALCTLQLESFTEQATQQFLALKQLALEKQSQIETTFNNQREIFDQAIKDNMISITAIKEETSAQKKHRQ